MKCLHELLHVDRPGLCKACAVVVAPVFQGDTLFHLLTTRTVHRRAVKRICSRGLLNWHQLFILLSGLSIDTYSVMEWLRMTNRTLGSNLDLQLQALMKIAKTHKVAH